uniref:Uncharacterized protein n=1 Tax=Spyridia filamentosa TaxID=196632 RepID=A0A1Z1MK27_SPYFI|nr:hypothetical protein [Spyridia filamentosa]ARW66192.1 hypothetical protein [Spyridia filamentosa]
MNRCIFIMKVISKPRLIFIDNVSHIIILTLALSSKNKLSNSFIYLCAKTNYYHDFIFGKNDIVLIEGFIEIKNYQKLIPDINQSIDGKFFKTKHALIRSAKLQNITSQFII